jgi:hypothetical protein
MEKTLLIIGFLATSIFSPLVAKDTTIQSSSFSEELNSGIEDGWYQATVGYSNYSYTLNVKVEDNTVTEIDFGNGGSIHSGQNSSEYTYSGGSLSFGIDSNGKITSGNASISVDDENGTKTFSIFIG